MTQDPHGAWADAAIAQLEQQQHPMAAEDSAWADAAMAQLEHETANKPGVLGQAANVARGIGAGVLENFVKPIAELPKTAAKAVYGESYREPPAWDPLSAIGRGAEAGAQALTPQSVLEQHSGAFQGGEMVGGVLPLLATSFLGRAAAATAGGAQMAGIQGQDAQQGGASGLATLGAMAGGAILGASGAGAGEQVLQNLAARSGGGFIRALEGAAKAGAEGGAAGVAFTALTNTIHNYATDQDIPLLQGAETNGLFGAALGATIASATEAAMALRARTGRQPTSQGFEGPAVPEEIPAPLADPAEHVTPPEATPADLPPGVGAPVMGAPIGRKLQGTTDNTLPPGVPPIGKQELLDQYAAVKQAAGSAAPMLQGGVGRGALGNYSALTDVVRQKKWGDLGTATHEIGHALERAVFGWTGAQSPWSGGQASRAGVLPKAQGELYRLGKDLYGKTVPAGGYLREGFAEYVRTWLTDSDALMTKAPEFTRWFDTQFMADPKMVDVLGAMQQGRAASTRWRLQGSFNRAAEQTYKPMSPEERLGRAGQALRYLTSAQAWTNGHAMADTMERTFEKRLGRPLQANEKLVDLFDSVRRQADPALKMLVEDHTGLDDGVSVTGKSLMQELAPAQGKYDLFHQYTWAKETESEGQMAAALGVAPKDTGLSPEDAAAIIEQTEREHPGVAQAANGYYAWKDRVNDFIGSIDPELGEHLRSYDEKRRTILDDPTHVSTYVPLHREVTDMEGLGKSSRGTGSKARTMTTSRERLGSGRPVKDILPEILKQTRERIEMAYRRAPLLRMTEMMDAHPEFAAPFLRMARSEDQVQFASALADARKPLIGQGNIDASSDMLGSMMSAFSKPMPAAGGRDVLMPLFRNGKTDLLELDRNVYKALTNLSSPQFSALWHNLLTVPKNVVVMGATALRPVFGLVLNPMVDLPTFLLNTRYYSNPATALAQWMRYTAYSLVDGLSEGRLHKMLKDPYYDAYKKLLLEYGQSYHVNAGRADVSAKRVMQTTGRRFVSPGSLIDYAANIISATEKAGRVAEVRGALKEMGWDGQRVLTPEEVQQARVSGKQVTIDFSQAGDIARAINQVVPFFNSPIQGTVAFARAAKDHPMRFAAGASAALGLGLACWNSNKDEEWYQEMPLDERSRYWMKRVNVNGRDEIFRSKKPQEFAAISTVLEELADAVYHKRQARIGQAMWEAIKIAAPTPQLPVLLNEPIQLLTNEDFYSGTHIIPDSQESLAAAGFNYEQKGDFTTKGAEAIGRWTNTSPLMVDHFLRGFFGGLPRDVMDITGMGAGLNGRETGASEIPIGGAAFKAGGMLNSHAQALQDFYRQFEIADGISKSKEHPETPEQARIRTMLTDAGAALSAMGYVRATYLKTNKERDQAISDMVQLARKAATMAAKGEWDPVTFEVQRQIQTTRRNAYDLGAGVLPRNWRSP